MQQITFPLDSEAVQIILNNNTEFKALITHIGEYNLDLRTDYFTALVRSIVGQQLSARVAEVIWSRVTLLCEGSGHITPDTIRSIPDEALRGAGLSKSKTTYIRDLSQKVINGELSLTNFDSMPDEEIVHSLCIVKGIGRWTAEMFLIFSLGRLDVWALDDGGLRRALGWLLGTQPISKEEMVRIGENLRPYRTVASLYLWEAINRDMI